MATKLPLIKFNVKERGRKFLGQERNFDIKKLCDSINGPACQERVRTRGMLGYYGHAPRVLAGMDTVEGAVIKGKYTELEPAVLTTYVKMYPNGDFEHQSEFLDTDSGKRAAAMYADKVGGFSTAIKAGSYELSGIDWVFNPNFNDNRPYILDSVDGLILDDIVGAMAHENAQFYDALLAKKQQYIEHLELSLNACQADNERLIDALATGKNAILDDTGFVLPMHIKRDKAERMKQDTKAFLDSTLVFPTQNDDDVKKAIDDAMEFISELRF